MLLKNRPTWLFLCTALIASCASEPKTPPQTPQLTPPIPVLPTQPKATADGNGDGVNVDQKIVDMCKLPNARFDFDSARVGTSARSALDAIANCFTDGPAKDKSLRIVGHADPRGETEYNFALGQRRAGAIAQYLGRAGLNDSRIATSSRGETEASGTSPDSWARDRKVEIYLAD